VRITNSPAAGAVYIRLTGGPLTPGRAAIQASTRPPSKHSSRLTGKDNRLAGLDIPAASSRLHHDLLEEAGIIS